MAGYQPNRPRPNLATAEEQTQVDALIDLAESPAAPAKVPEADAVKSSGSTPAPTVTDAGISRRPAATSAKPEQAVELADGPKPRLSAPVIAAGVGVAVAALFVVIRLVRRR